MRVEAPKPAELPAPVEASLSDSPLRRLVSPFLSIWDRLRRVPEHPVVGLLSPEQIQTEGAVIIVEIGGIFKEVPEYSHARSGARTKLKTKQLLGEDVSGDTMVIDAGFSVDNQRVTITMVEDSKEAPLSLGMKIQGLNAESQDPALRIQVETRKTGFYEPEISYEDHRPGGISVNPNTVDAVVRIRQTLADLRAKLSPQN